MVIPSIMPFIMQLKMKLAITLLIVLIFVIIYLPYSDWFEFQPEKCLEKQPEDEDVAQLYQDINFLNIKESVYTYPMRHFDDMYLYNIKEATKKTLNEDKELLMGMVKKVASKQNTLSSSFSGGSFRLLGGGVEFNLFFDDYQKRIIAFQPFTESIQSREVAVDAKKIVHLVMPLRGKLSSLSIFLDHLVANVIPVDTTSTLTVVYFKDNFTLEAKKILEKKLSTISSFEWRFIPVDISHFSRGQGIQIGVEAAAKSSSSLIFVCDVDVLFLPDFLQRCRANSIFENQVYFPVVYSLYNPVLVYLLHDKSVPPISEQLTITEDNGFWRYFGYGMFCMHRNEYDIVGGVPEFTSWGGEDLNFYEIFGKFPQIKIIRSLDPSIFHLYHPKNCTNVATSMYPSCVMSKAASEGTAANLGLLLFKTQDNLDVEGILSRRFYFFMWVPVLGALSGILSFAVIYQYLLLKKMAAGCQVGVLSYH